MDVHTIVSFKAESSSKLSGVVFGLIGNIFACCEAPMWLSKMKVHKCSVCSNVIARSV